MLCHPPDRSIEWQQLGGCASRPAQFAGAERLRGALQVYKTVKGAPYGELQLMVAARKQVCLIKKNTTIRIHPDL